MAFPPSPSLDSWSRRLPGHGVVELLKEVPGRRVVLKTRFEGSTCVTRIVMTRVPPHLGPTVRELALRGRGSTAGLPEDALLVLEGYRAAALARRQAGLPIVVDAGVLETGAGDDEPNRPGEGVFVTTRWVEGVPLDSAWTSLLPSQREQALLQVLDLLDALHECNVAYGDLKPGNVVWGRERVSFIDLDTLREVGDATLPVVTRDLTPRFAAPEQRFRHTTYLASDIWAFGSLAALLLGGAAPGDPGYPPPLSPKWARVIRACLRVEPLERPRARQVLRAARGEEVALGSWDGRSLSDPDAAVAAIVPRGWSAPVAEPVDSRTERVSDPVESDAVPALADRVTFFAVPAPLASAVLPGAPAPPPAQAPPLALVPPPARALPEVPELLPAQAFSDVSAGPSVPRTPSRGPIARFLYGIGAFARWTWRSRRPLLALVAVLVIAWGCWSVYTTVRDRREASRLADEVRSELKRHKTLVEANNPQALDAIVAKASKAVKLRSNPTTLGLLALATVWDQQWHYENAKWSADKYKGGDQLTQSALQGGPIPEAVLARAFLAAAACRLMPEKDPSRAASCVESRQRFTEAESALPKGPDSDWLRVELHWNAEMLESTEASRDRANGRSDEAQAHIQAALGHCGSALPLLEAAPVNGEELAEDCVSVAGTARDYSAYFLWSDRLVAYDLARRQKASPKHVARIFTGAYPSCVDERLDKRGVLNTASLSMDDPAVFCAYVGRVALGCKDRVNAFIQMELKLGLVSLTGRELPWDAALQAAQHPVRDDCALAGM
jgi:hypothetical protein